MGDKAGRTIVGSWNWLWGMPVESGGKVAFLSYATSDTFNRDIARHLRHLAIRVQHPQQKQC